MWFIAWIVLSLLVGMMASGKSLGFVGGFFVSLLLSPLIGFIIVMMSSDEAKPKKQTTTNSQGKMYSVPLPKEVVPKVSKADELKKLGDLKKDGVITEQEFLIEKQKVLNG